jgi:hypothetical protein
MIAIFRRFVQFLGLDLSAPSVCGGFLGVSAKQTDLRPDDRGPPPVRALRCVRDRGLLPFSAVARLVITILRRFVQLPR